MNETLIIGTLNVVKLIHIEIKFQLNVKKSKFVTSGDDLLGIYAMEKSLLLLTKMDTRKILVNARSIQTVESNPDTVIILSGGRKLLVKESLEEIWQLIQED